MAPSAVDVNSSGDASQNHEVVPVIDFSLFLKVKSLEKAKELFAAFRDSGFVYLQNHGVPQDIVDEAFTWVRQSSIYLRLPP
jgi:isopenicillin N synthase-like dioxygenase